MKKIFVFFGVIFLLWSYEVSGPELVEARHDCVPQVTRYQTNWICGGELFTGHIGTGYGHGHGGYNAPGYGYDGPRYSRHGRRHGDMFGEGLAGDIIGGIIGGVVAGVIMNNNQPAYTPPTVYAPPPPPPVYSVPAPRVLDNRLCLTTCVYVAGGSDEARRAVINAFLIRSYTVLESPHPDAYEIRVSDRVVGDPTVIINLTMIFDGRIKATAEGRAAYRRGELAKLDAVTKAASDAVGKL